MSSFNITLENFKAIGEEQKAIIRPLTLIFGPNSSGKSSFIHSLLLIREALETGNLDVHHTDLGGDSVDLGGFKQYIFGRKYNKYVRWSIEINSKKLVGRMAELFKSVDNLKVEFSFGILSNKDKEDKSPKLYKYSIFTDGTPFMVVKSLKGKNMKIESVNTKNLVFRSLIDIAVENYTTTDKLTLDDYLMIEKETKLMGLNIELTKGIFLPNGIDLTLFNLEALQNINPIGKASRNEDLNNVLKLILPWNINEILYHIHEYINAEMQELTYLGPLRSYPPRHFTLSSQQDNNWFAGGGEAWGIIQKSKEVRDKVNDWLGSSERLKTPYEITVRELIQADQIEKLFLKNLKKEYKKAYIGGTDLSEFTLDEIAIQLSSVINSSEIERLYELILFDKRTKTVVSHKDVGIGISQILPVLVNAYASKNKMIAIEQPELHLHPAIQAELGDVFIESAIGGNKNKFILETHSEHLILRVMRRIRETSNGTLPKDELSIKPSDVSIIYVEPMDFGGGSMLRFLELDEQGELLDPWPGGFFEEGFRERFL